jgi:Protein phosphatase 2C
VRRPNVLTPRIEVATRPAPGRASQDRYLVLPHAVAVLDGASDPDEPYGRDGGWYAQQLSEALAPALAVEREIPEAVAEAIKAVAERHALIPGWAPSSTVAVATWDDDTITAYTLGDSSVIGVRRDGTAVVLSDTRLAKVGGEHRRRYNEHLAAGHGYDDEHRAILRELLEAQRAARNTPDGYWIAEATREAAAHGVTASWPRQDLAGLLLATDGATAALAYGLYPDWATVWQAIERDGPDKFLAAIEDAETTDPQGGRWSRSKPSDDKTLAVVRLS